MVKRTSPESLLDTYHAERHPVAARVLRNTMAQVALMRADDRIEALRNTVCELLSMDEPRKRFAAEMSGLDIRYGRAAVGLHSNLAVGLQAAGTGRGGWPG